MIRDLAKKDAYRQEDQSKKKSIRKIVAFVIVLFAVSGAGYLYLNRPDPQQVVEQEPLAQEALPEEKEQTGRRNIYDRHFEDLAVSLETISIYVKPLEFDNIEETVARLAEVLNLEKQSLLEELKTQRSFKWLAKDIFPDKAEEVDALGLPGVYFFRQEKRFYAGGESTSHIIGEVKGSHGLSGIEFYYDEMLSDGLAEDGAGEKVAGRDLVLTLDVQMQSLLGKKMKDLLVKIEGNNNVTAQYPMVSALAMEAATGEILAYVQLPFADPADLQDKDGNRRHGRLLSAEVDPGSLLLLFKAGAAYNKGRTVVAGEEELPDDIKVLHPRIVKNLRIKKKKPEWAALADGSFSSVWLSEALSGEDRLLLSIYDEFFDMEEFTGPGDLCQVDLPGEHGGTQTGLGLLCGFAGLVNGANPVKPHFLQSTISAQGEMEEGPWQKVEQVEESEGKKRFFRFLEEAAPPAGFALVGEVLYPPEDFVYPDKKDIQESKTDRLEKMSMPVIDNCSTVLLAAVPLKKPEIVMVLVLDKARIDLAQPSPMQEQASSFLTAALKMHRKKSGVKSEPDKASREDIFRKWQVYRQQNVPGVQTERQEEGRMRDVRGMSLRKALQVLDGFDVKIMIEGSGRVKSQHPAPGGEITEQTVVVLKAEAAHAHGK